jgi:hypothetical protein
MGRGSEQEVVLIKNHLMRDDQALYGKVKARVTFVVEGVAKENTMGGPGGELMRSGGDSVRLTHTAEDMEVLVRGCWSEESDMRVESMNHLCGETVQEVRGGVEPLCPIALGKETLDKQCVNGNVHTTNDTLGFTILREHVGTRHPQLGAMRQN